MVRAWMPSVMLVALALGGCLGDDGEPAEATDVPDTAPPPPPAQTGTLIGSVTDIALVPIVAADVFLLENDAFATRSARDGTYVIEDVPPGEHLIRAEAEAFIGQSFLVRIKSGQTTVLDVALEPEAVEVATHETRELTGLIDCSIVVASADVPERPPCVEIDPNARSVFDLTVGAEPARVLAELIWTTDNPLSENLAMDAQTVGLGPQDGALGDVEGPSILRLDIPGPLLERFYGDGGRLRINVSVAPSLGDEEGLALGVAVQQEFTLLVTTFFVEPGPTDFSAVGE